MHLALAHGDERHQRDPSAAYRLQAGPGYRARLRVRLRVRLRIRLRVRLRVRPRVRLRVGLRVRVCRPGLPWARTRATREI